MTAEEAIEFGNMWLEVNADCKDSDVDDRNTYAFFQIAIKALEQEPVLDKIRAEIQGLRNCSCSCSDGIIDDVEEILDKYTAEGSEE